MDCKIIVTYQRPTIKQYLEFVEYIRTNKKVLDEMKAQRAFEDINFMPGEIEEIYKSLSKQMYNI